MVLLRYNLKKRGVLELKMIEKTVRKLDLERGLSIKEDLGYWLSKSHEDRIEAIEFLRRQCHGS